MVMMMMMYVFFYKAPLIAGAIQRRSTLLPEIICPQEICRDALKYRIINIGTGR